MIRLRNVKIIQGVFSLVATLFGLATILAGIRVLSGSDPGYTVLRALLIYNTAMGFVYVAAGNIMWRSLNRGKYMVAAIFVLNLSVLCTISYLHATVVAIAITSLYAMTLRTVVWLVLFLGLVWMSHGHHLLDVKRDAHFINPADPKGRTAE